MVNAISENYSDTLSNINMHTYTNNKSMVHTRSETKELKNITFTVPDWNVDVVWWFFRKTSFPPQYDAEQEELGELLQYDTVCESYFTFTVV